MNAMRYIFTIISFLTFDLAYSQTEQRIIYNFQRDSYWDSTLYLSEMAFYYEIKDSVILRSHYPIRTYLYSEAVSTYPLKMAHIYDTTTLDPQIFSYNKNGDSISIVFFNSNKNKPIYFTNHIVNTKDSIYSRQSEEKPASLSLRKTTRYSGIKTVTVDGIPKAAYCFEEYPELEAYYESLFYDITETYIDTVTLIPLQFVHKRYNKKHQYTNYFSVTRINAITDTIPKFSDEKELKLFEYKPLDWTEKQKSSFLKIHAYLDNDEYIQCLSTLLDGQVSFFKVEETIQFKKAVTDSPCNKYISKK